jgi:hypothetical protein
MQILNTPLQSNSMLHSALEPILLVTIPTVAEKFTIVIEKMTFATDLKLNNSLNPENTNLTHKDHNAGLVQPEPDGLATLCHMIP